MDNSPSFKLEFEADINDKHINSGNNYNNSTEILVNNSQIVKVNDFCSCYTSPYLYSKKWAIKQNSPIFYVNFHKIKEEISTQKTSWGSLRSFLGKHIKKIVDNDDVMKGKKDDFENEAKNSTYKVLKDSNLEKFINLIKKNYADNLRNNDCEIEFGLPDYEDIFLQMMFKIGLNGNKDKLVPIEHFGDGYISMFVMAVIKKLLLKNMKMINVYFYLKNLRVFYMKIIRNIFIRRFCVDYQKMGIR